ncbi:hypothetical protein VXE65_20235 [Mycolicibacterium conceptionense]|uniref:hypothetical protein n=1 Tax=Mycolicibacterium conceptionense TaxID=451644 RepID=UPI003204B371
MSGKWYEGSDGKPTHLELDDADIERLRAAGTGPILDEIGALAFPAKTFDDWFEACGFPDLAARARNELAEYTNAGQAIAEKMHSEQPPQPSR